MKPPKEKKLRDIVSQFESILENINLGITVQNMGGQLIYANDAAVRLTGFKSANELLKADPRKIIEKFEIQDEQGDLFPIENLPGRRVMKGEKNPEAVLRYVVKSTGVERWSFVRATIMHDENGKKKFVVNTFEDITNRRLEEERTNQFIAIASHELKTPLTNIKVLCQLLEKRWHNKTYEDVGRFLSKIDTKVNELTGIINEFLDMSKIRTGRLELNLELFNFDQLVKEIVQDFQQITASHRIILKGETGEHIVADRNRLIEIIVNLLRNARRYSPEGNKIIITLNKDTKTKRITMKVQDFGIGISRVDKKRIFEPFVRLHSQVREKTKGLGLGLFISSQLVSLHGGKMWVESEERKGSLFSFTLPFRPPAKKKRGVKVS